MGIFSKKKTEAKPEKKEAKKVPAAAAKTAAKKPSAKAQGMKNLYKTESKAMKSGSAKDSKKPERKYFRAYRVLLKPLITEKAASLGTEDKYVFAVATDANKIEIAKAMAEVYGIKPIKINIIKNKGKKVRYGRTFGKRKDWKKAIITLPKGKSIKVYEGV